ncbi:MAG: glucokinase, partial [Candidatus Acidiferrum sp.]
MIIAGDVGGTKCNLALFSEKNGKLTSVYKQRFASKDFAQFDLIVREFSRQAAPHLTGTRVRAAGFGVAGPVIENRVRATNLPWTVDAAILASELELSEVV